MADAYACFAVCVPGVEDLLAAELDGLALGPAVAEVGGAAFETDAAGLARAHLGLATATRVLVRTASFRARDFDKLVRGAARVGWRRFLAPGDRVRIEVTCRRSRLYHSDAVAERVQQAIEQSLGGAVQRIKASEDEADAPACLVAVRLVSDRCQLSVDASGAPLHHRGIRRETGPAPLRETLAAAALRACGWTGDVPLLDPFCGAGTILVEAAWLARRIAPGRHRGFAFERWPEVPAGVVEGARTALARGERERAPAPIVGSDRDPRAVDWARAAATRAGVAADVRIDCRVVSDLEAPPGPGLVLTNPPYGVRLRGPADLRNLYARLGAVLRERCPAWQVALFCPEPRLWRATGLEIEPLRRVAHGGRRIALVGGRVPG